MEEEFIPYEQAFSLKELGFKGSCFGWWNWTGKDLILIIASYVDIDPTPAPTYDQAFRWFRKKHNMCGWVQESYFRGKKLYQYHISIPDTLNIISNLSEEPYENLKLECLKKLIEIVKLKK